MRSIPLLGTVVVLIVAAPAGADNIDGASLAPAAGRTIEAGSNRLPVLFRTADLPSDLPPDFTLNAKVTNRYELDVEGMLGGDGVVGAALTQVPGTPTDWSGVADPLTKPGEYWIQYVGHSRCRSAAQYEAEGGCGGQSIYWVSPAFSFDVRPSLEARAPFHWINNPRPAAVSKDRRSWFSVVARCFRLCTLTVQGSVSIGGQSFALPGEQDDLKVAQRDEQIDIHISPAALRAIRRRAPGHRTAIAHLRLTAAPADGKMHHTTLTVRIRGVSRP